MQVTTYRDRQVNGPEDMNGYWQDCKNHDLWYLSSPGVGDVVKVDVARLEDEIEPYFDFLKLDLQGREKPLS